MKEYRIFMYIQLEGHSVHPFLIAKVYDYDIAVDLCEYYQSQNDNSIVYFDLDTKVINLEDFEK